MVPRLFLALLLLGMGNACAAAQPGSAPVSEMDLGAGHYELTITVLDETRGTGQAGVEVMLKLRRGIFLLGRQKQDLQFSTNKQGQVLVKGLPKGKVDLYLRLDQTNEQRYEPDLQPGPKKSVQLRISRYRILIEWQLV